MHREERSFEIDWGRQQQIWSSPLLIGSPPLPPPRLIWCSRCTTGSGAGELMPSPSLIWLISRRSSAALMASPSRSARGVRLYIPNISCGPSPLIIWVSPPSLMIPSPSPSATGGASELTPWRWPKERKTDRRRSPSPSPPPPPREMWSKEWSEWIRVLFCCFCFNF